jgi:hypothetical protein
MANSRAGGGALSKNVRHVTAAKTEPRPEAVHPGGVGQLGEKQGSHVTGDRESKYRGDPFYNRKGYTPPVGPANMALSGPGAGREVMPSGGQGRHGAPAPGNAPAKSTDILNQFGPDYKASRS